MPEFIRTVYSNRYTDTLININYIGRIEKNLDNPDVLEVIPVSDNTSGCSRYVFKKDLMRLLDARNQELIDQITEKQNP